MRFNPNLPDPLDPSGRIADKLAGLEREARGAASGSATSLTVLAYTPVWTGSVTNPVRGNGTISGRYQQVGKLVVCQVGLAMGSTTTYGSGVYGISLPIAPITTAYHGTARYFDSSAGSFYSGITEPGAGSTVNLLTNSQPSGFVGPTVPFTWASGDVLNFTLVYESA